MVYKFGSSNTNAYLTPLERKRQDITDTKRTLRGKHTDWEKVLNNLLGRSGIVNDDEYKFMSKKGVY